MKTRSVNVSIVSRSEKQLKIPGPVLCTNTKYVNMKVPWGPGNGHSLEGPRDLVRITLAFSPYSEWVVLIVQTL